MKRSALVALALAGAAAAGAASADTRAYVAVEPAQPPVYVERHEHWRPDQYAYGGNEYEGYQWHRECHAQRWDPNARYMPGQEVWRKGQVYEATEVSRHVYNVNSPPEWTPNYWRPVRCR